ncbi:transcriptional regulator, ArsR family [Collimonas sp. OK607]|uniref:ArsR/SmtB family transcription factor n=1 Tax=Collimonas sp. OK607 TaxID=1798194 RepID=UPI0008DF2356|nr:helix-turn-helix transcriptional regulator [Collimonas sp. OK607]SFB13648.1 transcriptional regulator, ArsR family [Collimonas sp. OK607]
MNDEPDLSRLARTIGDPTRIRMLSLLMEGRALTAKELAYGTEIKPATATAHLRQLLDDKLLDMTTQGRHKYFRLASPEVARLIESLMVFAPKRKRIGPATGNDAICTARFCYDHLAGKLGTRLTEVLIERGLLNADDGVFSLSAQGETWFNGLGINTAELQKSRRQFAYPCLDWSERRDHLAGALGATLAKRMIELGWLTRTKNSRVVGITPEGRTALAEQFGIALHQE